MHKRRLVKPDGRALILYGDVEIPADLAAPQPPGETVRPASQLRWHPFRAEWVAYAGHRQERTFLPPSGYDPLAPTQSGREPTEVPPGPWKVAVFENRFPALTSNAPQPPASIVPAQPGRGACEVVIYTQEAEGGLGQLSLHHLELLIEVWGDRTAELGARDEIEYVMPFENRGVEVGATLHHPHGQIYAYSFVPPIAATEQREEQRFHERHGRTMLERHIESELSDGRRILYAGDRAVAFVPAFARYPYEVWVAPRRACPSLATLDSATRSDLARALKTVVLKYDGVRDPFPYVMVFHQAPTDGAAHPESHLHAEFYPAYRTKERLKYLAGTEIGAGMFTNDALPELKGAELQAIPVAIEDHVP